MRGEREGGEGGSAQHISLPPSLPLPPSPSVRLNSHQGWEDGHWRRGGQLEVVRGMLPQTIDIVRGKESGQLEELIRVDETSG